MEEEQFSQLETGRRLRHVLLLVGVRIILGPGLMTAAGYLFSAAIRDFAEHHQRSAGVEAFVAWVCQAYACALFFYRMGQERLMLRLLAATEQRLQDASQEV